MDNNTRNGSNGNTKLRLNGKAYEFDRFDCVSNIRPGELVLLGGEVKERRTLVEFGYGGDEPFAVVRLSAPTSPFDGDGKAYGPDADGCSLVVRIPKWEHVSPKVPRSHILVEAVAGTAYGGAYVDPKELMFDLAEHFKSLGVTPLGGK